MSADDTGAVDTTLAAAICPSIHWRCKLCHAQGGIDIQWPHRNDSPTLADLHNTIERIAVHALICREGYPTCADFTVEL